MPFLLLLWDLPEGHNPAAERRKPNMKLKVVVHEAVEGCLSVDVQKPKKTTRKARVIKIAI